MTTPSTAATGPILTADPSGAQAASASTASHATPDAAASHAASDAAAAAPMLSDAEQVARLAAHADLPGAEQLLTPDALAALHGEPRTLLRGRVKPGASVLVAHRRAGAAPELSPEDIGWTLLIASAHKRDGVLRRAARCGATVREHPAPADGPFLLSGGLPADPRLGRMVERVLRRSRETSPRVLSANPARHVVLHLPQTRQVVRIADRPLEDLLHVTRCWTALGVPTPAQQPWRRASSALVSEHWGEGDLAHHARRPSAVPAARATGAALARLHAAAVTADELPAARLGDPVPATLPEIAALLPEQSGLVRRLGQQLAQHLPDRPRTGLIHADLSPDQVLLDRQGPGAPPQIRFVDLDRSGHGPLGADLGSWLAACLSADTPQLAAALLEGYSREGTPPDAQELAAWTARALLAGAIDPVRRFHPRWSVVVAERLALAAAILEDPARLPTRPASSGDRPAGSTGIVVPERVLSGGTVWTVDRGWPDDGRGLPLELRADQEVEPDAEQPAEGSTAVSAAGELRGARLDADTGEVTVFAPGTDPRLPGLARCLAEHPDAEVVSHRPGKRAVVRIPAAGDRAEQYRKIVRPGRAARLREALTSASSFDGPFRLQREIAADDDSVTTAALTGTTLHEGLPVTDGSWRRAWRETLTAWAEALAAGPVTAADSAMHGPAQESAVLESWRDRARLVDPAGSVLRDRAIDAARRELDRLDDPPRPALIHRDLHDKQILHAPGLAPGLLDVDTAVLGDPALDLGTLRAHASWRELQGIWSAEHAHIAREEIDAAALRARLPAATLAAYESATLARLTCVYAFRPRWRAHARELAESLRPTPGDAHPPGDHPALPGAPDAPADLQPTPDERTVTT